MPNLQAVVHELLKSFPLRYLIVLKDVRIFFARVLWFPLSWKSAQISQRWKDVHSLAKKIRDYFEFPWRPISKAKGFDWFDLSRKLRPGKGGGGGRLCLHRSATNAFPRGSKLDTTLLRYVACIRRRPRATEAFFEQSQCMVRKANTDNIAHRTFWSRCWRGSDFAGYFAYFNLLSKVVHAPVVKLDWVIKVMVLVKWKQLQHH